MVKKWTNFYLIMFENKTNFFENRVSAYNKAGVGGSAEDKEFDLDADF